VPDLLAKKQSKNGVLTLLQTKLKGII